MGIFSFLSSKTSLQESGVLTGTSDRHSHILWGVDDGIKTPEEAIEVLDYEESIGVSDVWCTPHVMEDIPNMTQALEERFSRLCDMYTGKVRLHLAAEYMLDTLFEKRLAAHDLLTMEDDVLLVETSTVVAPYDLNGTLGDIMSAGYRPLFAHPERCRFLEVKDYEELYSIGVRFQLNIAALTGYYGRTVRTKAEHLLRNGMYSAYGSDCHRSGVMKYQYSRPEITKEIINKLTFP